MIYRDIVTLYINNNACPCVNMDFMRLYTSLIFRTKNIAYNPSWMQITICDYFFFRTRVQRMFLLAGRIFGRVSKRWRQQQEEIVINSDVDAALSPAFSRDFIDLCYQHYYNSVLSLTNLPAAEYTYLIIIY